MAQQYHYRTMRVARMVIIVAAIFVGVAAVLATVLLQGGPIGMPIVVVAVIIAVIMLSIAAWRLPTAGVWFEHRLLWRFREVCKHKGLTTKTESGQYVYPRLARLSGGRSGFRVQVLPLLGQTVADWERAAPAFALAYGVTGARVRDEGNGRLALLVGYQPMESHSFEPGVVEPPVVVNWRDQLRSVVVARREGGEPYALPLLDSHVLIAGTTGAGKGSVIWSLLLRLLPAYRAGVVRFWGFDPKRMELSIGRSVFGDNYAAKPDDVLALLERAHEELQARADELAGRVRRFEPSREHPLHVLVIDELGYLASMLPDRKMRDQAERLMSAILALGRAVGFVVIGALQDPRKETLGFRDLFPTRVAMRLPKPMVDLVLGNGMYEAGAQCDLIPPFEAGAGVAFVVDDGSPLPVCVRMSWCSDDLIRQAVGDLDRLAPPTLASVHQLPVAS